MMDKKNRIVIESINYCFSKCVDEKSLEIAYDMLKSMELSDSDVNTVLFLFAGTCAKHYKHGYKAGHDALK